MRGRGRAPEKPLRKFIGFCQLFALLVNVRPDTTAGSEASVKFPNRAARTETKLETHLANQEKRAAKKEKIFYVVIAVIVAGVGIFEVIK